VTVQEGVALNARVRMSSHSEETREYLLPVLLRAESGAAPREWVALLDTCEELLEHCGFVIETRSRPATLMRSIFRSSQPLTWQEFRNRLEALGDAFRPATTDDGIETESLARRAAAQTFLEALGDAPEAIGILGISVIRSSTGVGSADRAGDDDASGEAPNQESGPMRIEQHPEFLPTAAADADEPSPRPADILLEMQRIQSEVLGETARTPAAGA
jgi:hypothetical protein